MNILQVLCIIVNKIYVKIVRSQQIMISIKLLFYQQPNYIK